MVAAIKACHASGGGGGGGGGGGCGGSDCSPSSQVGFERVAGAILKMETTVRIFNETIEKLNQRTDIATEFFTS